MAFAPGVREQRLELLAGCLPGDRTGRHEPIQRRRRERLGRGGEPLEQPIACQPRQVEHPFALTRTGARAFAARAEHAVGDAGRDERHGA
jgi:hypothetical protein